jgi:hypothetical protein
MPSEADVFIDTITERLLSIRGRGLMMSPADWLVMNDWWDRRIPLHVITECMDEAEARGVRPRNLRYFVPAVDEAWRQVLDMQGLEEAGR